ncbi:MAG TPA: hypothetical protein VMT91_10605, partial [Anaerolineales bacterium]|nr:hypothetical protein [Anaerolineales bacterium]
VTEGVELIVGGTGAGKVFVNVPVMVSEAVGDGVKVAEAVAVCVDVLVLVRVSVGVKGGAVAVLVTGAPGVALLRNPQKDGRSLVALVQAVSSDKKTRHKMRLLGRMGHSKEGVFIILHSQKPSNW